MKISSSLLFKGELSKELGLVEAWERSSGILSRSLHFAGVFGIFDKGRSLKEIESDEGYGKRPKVVETFIVILFKIFEL